MSLQATLKAQQEALGKAVTAMREYGLAMTEASEKSDDASLADNSERFEKAKADFVKVKLNVQNLESAIAAEREMETLANPVIGRGRETTSSQEKLPERQALLKVAQREAFGSYLRFGERSNEYYATTERLSEELAMTPTERHALFGIRGDLGGFLVPDDVRSEIVKNVAGFAVIRRAGARVIPTSSSTVTFPSIKGGTDPYSSGVSGAWRAEGSQGTDGSAPATQDQPTFGQERIPVHVWQPGAIVITRELLSDAAVNLDATVAELIAETKAMDEDAAFLKGNGVGQPRGIIDYAEAATGPSITVVNSASAGAYQYDELVDTFTTLPAQYRDRAVWLTNSISYGKILQLKDSSQMPILYQPSLPDTLFGKKVWLTEQIAAPATDSYSLIFGVPAYYGIAERMDLRIQRLEERFAPNVGLLATARLGGGVLRTQAFVIHQLSA